MNNNIESYIKTLESKNIYLIQELQIYDCCSNSLIRELEYLKNILHTYNIVY